MRFSIALVIIVAAIALAGCTLPTQSPYGPPANGTDGGSCEKPAGELTAQEAAGKALDYIKAAIPEGITATLKGVKEENGLYKITVEFANTAGQTEENSFYVAKDGARLFTSSIDITQPAQKPPEAPPFDANDTDVPELSFYVMSFCPPGQQARAAIEPIYLLLGAKATFSPHYVIYDEQFVRSYGEKEADYCVEENGSYYCSLHGINELREGMRQLCVYRNYDTGTFFKYAGRLYGNCSLSDVETCWKPIAEKAGINTTLIESCVAENGTALVKAEKALNDEYGVEGSPTIFVNGMAYEGQRSANDLKSALCTGFKSVPAECSQALSSTAQQAASCST